MPPKLRKNTIRPPVKRTSETTPKDPSTPDSPDPWNPPTRSQSTTSSLQVQPPTSPPGTYSYQSGVKTRTQTRQSKTSLPKPQPPSPISLEEAKEEEKEDTADFSISLEEVDSDFDPNIEIPDYGELGPGSGQLSGTIYITDSSSSSNLYTDSSDSSDLYIDTAYESSPVSLAHHYPDKIHRQNIGYVNYAQYLAESGEYERNYIIENQKLLLLAIGLYTLLGIWGFSGALVLHYFWYKFLSGIRLTSWPFGSEVLLI